MFSTATSHSLTSTSTVHRSAGQIDGHVDRGAAGWSASSVCRWPRARRGRAPPASGSAAGGARRPADGGSAPGRAWRPSTMASSDRSARCVVAERVLRSRSACPAITIRRLLKSWATPPVSWPSASIFCACASRALARGQLFLRALRFGDVAGAAVDQVRLPGPRSTTARRPAVPAAGSGSRSRNRPARPGSPAASPCVRSRSSGCTRSISRVLSDLVGRVTRASPSRPAR